MTPTAILAIPSLPGLPNPIADLAQDAFTSMAESMIQGVGDAVKTMMTFWVGVGSGGLVTDCQPQPGGGCAGDGGAAVWMQESTQWLVAIAMVASIIFTAYKMIWERDGKPLGDVFLSLVKYVVAAGIGIWAIAAMTQTTDEWSRNILTTFGAESAFGENMFKYVGANPMMMLLLGMIGGIVAIAQIILLVFRDFVLIFLAGVLPLVAATSASAQGSERLERLLKWVIAFLLYKPVAAFIYGVVFWYAGKQDADIRTFLIGLVGMVVAVVALPALMRLVAPAAAAASGRGGGMVAVGTAVATGAVMTVATGGAAAPAAAAQVGGAGQQAVSSGVPDGDTRG